MPRFYQSIKIKIYSESLWMRTLIYAPFLKNDVLTPHATAEHANLFACFALMLLESSTMPFGYNSADKYWCKLSAEPDSTAFIERRGCVSHHSSGFENEPSALISPEDRFCAQTSLIFSKVSSSITPSVIEYA